MRALSKRESNQDPGDTRGPAWGLMQVVEVVRNSWNKRKPGEALSRPDLLDPVTNVRVASDLLNRIVIAYGKHPDKNMQEDWSNPAFVQLVTAGWNSGYSESGGVGRVARYLEANQIPVTHDNVFRYAVAGSYTAGTLSVEFIAGSFGFDDQSQSEFVGTIVVASPGTVNPFATDGSEDVDVAFIDQSWSFIDTAATEVSLALGDLGL